MQDLYYDNTGSLLLVREDNTKLSWDITITSLQVSASINQVVAYTGSTIVSKFPLSNTNVYYPPYPSAPLTTVQQSVINRYNTPTSSYAPLGYTYNLNGVFESYETSGSFYVDNYTTSTSVVDYNGTYIQGASTLNPGDSYTISTDKGIGPSNYTSSLLLTDNGTVLYDITNYNSASEITFVPTASHQYSVVAEVFSEVVPVTYVFYRSPYAQGVSNFYIEQYSGSVLAYSTGSLTGSIDLVSDMPYTVRVDNNGGEPFTSSLVLINKTTNQYEYIKTDIYGFNQYSYTTVLQRGNSCLLYTSPSPRDLSTSRMPSSA